MREVDDQMGRVVDALHTSRLWNRTLLVVASDNGGLHPISNMPFRGIKGTNWEGGMRVLALVSGGALPTSSRGERTRQRSHISDWYATFCYLAGVPPSDASMIPPLPHDHNRPGTDLYSNTSYPDIDSVNLWPLLAQPSSFARGSPWALHPSLQLSRHALLVEGYKLITRQPTSFLTFYAAPQSAMGWGVMPPEAAERASADRAPEGAGRPPKTADHSPISAEGVTDSLPPYAQVRLPPRVYTCTTSIHVHTCTYVYTFTQVVDTSCASL